MDPAQIAFLVGSVLFGVEMLVALVALIAYVTRSQLKVAALDGADRYRVHWYNTLYVWIILLFDCILFFMLYMTQYLGQGILFGILWSRWIFLSAIALFNAYCLAYIMTQRARRQTDGKATYDEEERDVFAVFLVVMQTFAYLSLWFGTWSLTVPLRAFWVTASAFFFIISMALYIWPFNKWRVEGSVYHRDIDGAPKGAYYHRVFYLMLGVIYVVYFLVWVLSETNGLTDVIGYNAEVATLMVFEVVWMAVFEVYMISVMSSHMVHTLAIMDTQTSQVTYDAHLPMNRRVPLLGTKKFNK